MIGKILYLPRRNDGRGETPPPVDLSKAAQVGPKRVSKYPFQTNRDKPWRKPLNGKAVRRAQVEK